MDCTSRIVFGIAVQPFFQIDAPVLAERRDRLPRARIDGAQEMIAREQQPPVGAVLALPIIDPAVGDHFGVRVRRKRPDLFARRRVQRDDRVVLGQNVHHAVHHERIEGVLVVVAGRIRPGDLQLAYVGSIDLGQRGVLRGVGCAPVVAPGFVVLRKERERRQKQQDSGREDGEHSFHDASLAAGH